MTHTEACPLAGIDPLHPLVESFDGSVADLPAWACDPGSSVFLYMFTVGSLDSLGEIVYVGITRSPHIRFERHRKTRWWSRVTHVHVDRIDCRYHDGEVCTLIDLDRSARSLERWAIGMFEPTENIALGFVD